MSVAEQASASLRAAGLPTAEDYARLQRWARFLAAVKRGAQPALFFWLGADAGE